MKTIASSKSGFTLIEIVISVLLTAVMAAAVLSIALTATRGSGRSERKTICAQATRQLSAELKNFVTAYYDYNADNWIANMSEIRGPLAGAAGVAGWQWASQNPGSNGTGPVTDTCNSGATPCYALKVGVHRLGNFLPTTFETQYSAYIEYTVAAGANFGSGQLRAPQVTVVCNWTEPQ